jgi:phenylacetic acid degradation operon negative regulatory protein
MDTWRTFPNHDPDLPAELLPADWPRAAARDLFVEIYDTLGPLAEFRVKQIVAEFDPGLAELVAHHRTGSILTLT